MFIVFCKHAYYRRDDVALYGFAKYFDYLGKKKYDNLYQLVEYQNKRGGRVVFNAIDKPAKENWGSGLDGLVASLDLQKTLNKVLFFLWLARFSMLN